MLRHRKPRNTCTTDKKERKTSQLATIKGCLTCTVLLTWNKYNVHSIELHSIVIKGYHIMEKQAPQTCHNNPASMGIILSLFPFWNVQTVVNIPFLFLLFYVCCHTIAGQVCYPNTAMTLFIPTIFVLRACWWSFICLLFSATEYVLTCMLLQHVSIRQQCLFTCLPT